MAGFRFTVQLSGAPTGAAWRDLARKVEDLGYSTLYVPDHLDGQWGPLVALTVAAEATTALTVGSLVFDNDFRHPCVLAKELASLDLASSGRFEFGLGAGWMHTDYETSGLAFDAASVRINRMEEALQIYQQLFSGTPATFHGEHYQVNNATLTPEPHTPGGPPLVIGGGSRRVLTLAGKYASIVSMVPSLAAGAIGPEVAAGGVADAYLERLSWVKDGAGSRFDDLELQIWTAFAQITDDATSVFEAMGPMFGLTAEQVRSAPVALCGSVPEVIDQLEERRATFGFSNIVLHEAEFEAFAPVVAALAGR